MVAPLVVPALFLLSSLIMGGIDIYSSMQTTSANDRVQNYVNDFYSGAQLENKKYFDDYIRRHHLTEREIKYPYRVGMNFDASKIYSSGSNLVSNEYRRIGSIAHGIGNSGNAGIYGFSKYSKKKVR